MSFARLALDPGSALHHHQRVQTRLWRV